MSNEREPLQPLNDSRPSVSGDTGGSAGGDSSRNEPDAVQLKLEGLFDLLRRPVGSGSQPSDDRIDETSQAWQRFRILRPHAKGGLGEVWVALDEELQRNVALKEIQPRYARHVESRSRFLREATITGQLEHPGIVPVYAVGQHDDGRPFYAMRFIQGDSLQQAIDRFHQAHSPGTDPQKRQLELRKLLDRFIDVCNAVAYAHSRGVVHRDLKPGNIMLGAFGETLVVDWGLAKSIIGSDDNHAPHDRPPPTNAAPTPTQIGSTIGTPAYMSPEQAAGHTDQLGPLSDVYSLGATLYCVLTGKPPFADSDVETVLKKVQRGDIAPPRQVNATVPAALEAVCLKAMALDPDARFVSPQAIADDVQRWLADEAVSAYRDPLTVRLSRWARRHRAVVASASALLLTAVVGLVINNRMLKDEQKKTEDRRLEAVDAEKRAVTSQKLAEANERLAIQNKETAERNRELAEMRTREATERFKAALEAFDVIVNGVQTELEYRAVPTAFRRDLLEAAQRGIDRLMAGAEHTPQADKMLIWSHLKMGDIQTAIGNLARAGDEFKTATSIAIEALEKDPSQQDLERDVSTCHARLGRHAFNALRLAEAHDEYAQALAIARRRLSVNPRNQDIQREVALLCNDLGNVDLALGDLRLAAEHFNKSLEIHKGVAVENPFNWTAQCDVLVSYHLLGDVLSRRKDFAGAKSMFLTSHAIATELLVKAPTNRQVRRHLAISCERLGSVCFYTNDISGAQEWHKRAFNIYRQLAADDPDDVQAIRNHYVANENMGDVMKAVGNVPAAAEYFQTAIAIAQSLVERRLNFVQSRRDLASAHGKFALAAQVSGNIAAARQHFQTAVTTLEGLANEVPDSPEIQFRLAWVAGNFANCEMLANDYQAATEWFQKAIPILTTLQSSRNGPEDTRYQFFLEQYRRQLDFCNSAVRAIDDIEFALEQPPDSATRLLGVRAMVLVNRGDHAASAGAAEKLAEFGEKDPAHWYNAACGFSLCIVAVANNKQPAELSGDDKATQERYAARVMELLHKAEGAGLFKKPATVANLKQNPQLNALRSRPEFQKFVAQFADEKP